MRNYNRIFTLFLSIGALSLLAISFSSLMELQIIHILVLSIFAAITESLSVRMKDGKTLSVSSAIILCALIAYGAVAAIWVSLLSSLLKVMRDEEQGTYIHIFNRRIEHSLFSASMYVITSAASSFTYTILGGYVFSSAPLNATPEIAALFTVLSRQAFVIIVTIFVDMLVNTLIVAGYCHTIGKGKLLQEWAYDFFWSYIGLLFVGLIGVLFTSFYICYGWFIALIVFAPLFLARYTFSLYSNLRVSYMDTVKSLSDAIEAKDHYTRGHSQRVQEYSALIADELKYTPKQKEILQYAALLHDVGKIGVTETILNKPGKLDEQEFDSIRQHPEMGARIISNVKYLKECVPIIKYHHKYYDGSGYPEVTNDEKIPYESYILGVADAFDAMTSKRQYREPYTLDRAIEEIRRCSGTQFEPSVADAFISAFTKQQAKAKAQPLPTRRKRRGSASAVPANIAATKEAGTALEPMESLDSVQS